MNFNWSKYGIDISKVRGGKTTCPKCSHTRKHRNDPCLSVDIAQGLFNCHNCEFKGSAAEFKKREYLRPLERLEKLSSKVLEWFENDRKISNNTLLRFKVTEAKEFMPQLNSEVTVMCFNYYRGGELVNIKFRGPKKSFKMAKDAELIFYNLDAIKDEKECVIVEGEIDCLTLYECGVFNAVSVPNGASKGSQKLEYLDNCWNYFEGKEKIIIATDNDEAGKSLKEELLRRLGKERCYSVDYPEGCKDFNEVLLKYGKDEVKAAINDAEQIPLEGIVSMEDVHEVTFDWFLHGYPKGTKARIDGFDEFLTFVPGQLTLITGIPGHGKDEFVNYIETNLSKYEGWKWGICSFEETPEITTTKLIEKYIGKSFDFRQNHFQRITQEDYEKGIVFVNQHFKFFDTEKSDTDVDSILNLAEQMVKRYGINGFCLNPWNWVDHLRKEYMSETEYVSQCLTKIVRFAKKFKVAFFLIAHTTKMPKNTGTGKYEVPTLYSINGSANFFNKTHNGITIYRDYATNCVDVHVQKVKQSWLGKIGLCSFEFDTFTRQYKPI